MLEKRRGTYSINVLARMEHAGSPGGKCAKGANHHRQVDEAHHRYHLSIAKKSLLKF
jgi:hypothetical protein